MKKANVKTRDFLKENRLNVDAHARKMDEAYAALYTPYDDMHDAQFTSPTFVDAARRLGVVNV